MNITNFHELPSLKEFIKRLHQEVGKNNIEPLIFLEFKSAGSNRYQSRISILEIPSENQVLYRYADKSPTTSLKDWRIRTDDYRILRIVRPPRINIRYDTDHLGIIQVCKRHD